MSMPNIPDPSAAAQRVKGLARDLASEVTEGYRKSTRGLRLRVAIGGTWALLATLSLVIAFYTHERDERARLDDTSVGRVVSLSNSSKETWEDVSVTLDGGWTYFERTIRRGQSVGIGITKFKKDGVSAPSDLGPRWVEIKCDQVDAKIELSQR
jgi:hypothetical protein